MLAIAAITFLLIFLLTDSSRDGGQTPQGGAAIATASPQPVLVPPVTTDEKGQPRIEMEYQAAFDDVLVPEGEQQMALGAPEAPAAVPTRKTRGE